MNRYYVALTDGRLRIIDGETGGCYFSVSASASSDVRSELYDWCEELNLN